jgi:hypothetical protein
MVDTLRKPLFLIAVVLIFIVLLIELGSGLVASLGAGPASDGTGSGSDPRATDPVATAPGTVPVAGL